MAETVRAVAERFPGVETIEGAGVRLRRSFSNREVPLFDPFLLLDRFGSENPDDYLAGFPWHPHRGIETVTYLLGGEVEHGDTLGHQGVIRGGDLQWMKAGSGIIHQEMPKRTDGVLQGFQLWINLPRSEKMTVPAYRGLSAPTIPSVETDKGARVRVVAGEFQKVEGPVQRERVEPTYLDVTVPAGGVFEHRTRPGDTVFAHLISGTARFDPTDPRPSSAGETVLFKPGDLVRVSPDQDGARFLLVAGRPLHEPVAWYGPIVMNTSDELREAVRELRSGAFVRHRGPTVEE